MPPASASNSSECPLSKSDSNIVTINVGGQFFQTTKQTLYSAGSKSFFAKIAEFQPSDPFIDRDPELFAVLLSLLRTGNLPSKAKAYDLQDLISESQFYGIEHTLRNSLSGPSQFEPFNLQKSIILPLNGRDTPSAIATSVFGSVHVAHGSKITSFDWSLRRKSTYLTQFIAVDSLLALSDSVVWFNSPSNWIFAGAPICELRIRPPQFKFNNATKLKWSSGYNLLMASGSHSGPSGVSGSIRLWDVRSGNVVWEMKEQIDCFVDVTVSDNLSVIFKVGVHSGEAFFVDMRNLSYGNSWVCLGDNKKVLNGRKEGIGCKVEDQGNQVFCTKGGDIEMWSEVIMGSAKKGDEKLDNRVFKKNLMGLVKDIGGSKITNLTFGGNKMFLTRKDQQFVEVWQSSTVEL
ncbi:hypothetical protein K1719_042902 [Acacia pycnantha]|nr:hypothetical protein K1719_042902 [Acacia pycnantha]